MAPFNVAIRIACTGVIPGFGDHIEFELLVDRGSADRRLRARVCASSTRGKRRWPEAPAEVPNDTVNAHDFRHINKETSDAMLLP
jgi:hypothetical protein